MRFLRRAEQQHPWTADLSFRPRPRPVLPCVKPRSYRASRTQYTAGSGPGCYGFCGLVHDGTDAGSAPSAGRRHDARRTRPRLLTVRHVGPALRPEAAAVPGSAHRRDHAHELADHPASRATPYALLPRCQVSAGAGSGMSDAKTQRSARRRDTATSTVGSSPRLWRKRSGSPSSQSRSPRPNRW